MIDLLLVLWSEGKSGPLRKLRGLVENRLAEITTRTFQGRYLLRPSDEVNCTILGVLGRVQRRTELDLCAFAFLSNHYHMLVSDEPEAQIRRLSYLLSQGVKEGLVRHPEDWPGVHCVSHLLGGQDEVRGGMWRDQTAQYNPRRRGKVLRLEEFLFAELVRLRPIPCWETLSRLERCGLIKGLLKQIEQLARQRLEETGRAPLGRKRILLQVPDYRPQKVERSPAPAFHAATREHYRQMRERHWAFHSEFRDSAAKLKEGAIGVVFPPGCFPPRLPYVPETRAGP